MQELLAYVKDVTNVDAKELPSRLYQRALTETPVQAELKMNAVRK